MTSPSHNKQLAQFAEIQLAELSTRDICASTVHLILATAFFTGAAIGLAKSQKTDRKKYLASLCHLLQSHFGLSTHNAEGMVESNARLYKRYRLIEKIYNLGMQTVLDWQKDPTNCKPALKTLLTQYQSLSMSELNIEGVKAAKPAPVEIEAITHVEVVPEVVTPSPRWGRRLMWLLLIVLLGLIGYGVMFPGQIPSRVLEILPAGIRHLLDTTAASLHHLWDSVALP